MRGVRRFEDSACLCHQEFDKGHALLFVHISLAFFPTAVLLAVPSEPHSLPALCQLATCCHPAHHPRSAPVCSDAFICVLSNILSMHHMTCFIYSHLTAGATLLQDAQDLAKCYGPLCLESAWAPALWYFLSLRRHTYKRDR